MINIVINTNIIVSAILSPQGNSFRILNLVGNDESVRVYYGAGIFAEYKKVLAYKRLNISDKTQASILNAIRQFGILIEPNASTFPMPDETDRIFYDTAQTGGAILITGNKKHYPDEPFILKPEEFCEQWRIS